MIFRKLLFWCHLSVGLAAGLVLAVMAATGITMAFEPQVEAFAARHVATVVPPSPEAAPLPLSQLAAGLGDRPPSGVTIQAGRTAAAAFAFGRERTVYVDPYTGAVLGEAPKGAADFFRAVENLHRWLGLAGAGKEVGKAVTGAAALLLFFMILSGLWLWWPRGGGTSLRNAATFRPRARGKARDWNWHTVIGFWLSPLLLASVLTGLVLAFPWANALLYTLTGTPAPAGDHGGHPRAERPAEAGTPLPAGIDTFLPAVTEQMPGWRVVTLSLKPDHVTAQVEGDGFWNRLGGVHLRSSLVLDADTGEVVKAEPFAAQNLGRKLRAWTRPIHTGQAGGLVGQALAVLSASALLMLVWTGFSLSWRRFFGRPANPNV